MKQSASIFIRICKGLIFAILYIWYFNSDLAPLSDHFLDSLEFHPLVLLHIIVILLLSTAITVLMLVLNRKKLKEECIKPSWWGLFFMVLSMAGWFIAFIMMLGFVAKLMMVFMLFGYVLLITGWRIIRYIWMTFFLLLFVIPLPNLLLANPIIQTCWFIVPYFAAAIYLLISFTSLYLFIEDKDSKSELPQQPQQVEESMPLHADKQKRFLRRFLLDPVFIAGILLFILSFSLKSELRSHAGKKEPVEIRKSLEKLDENKLQPFMVISKHKIENPDVLASLDTTEYLMWILEDTEVKETSPVRYCSLFITYYPLASCMYTPEQTYIGGGNEFLFGEPVTLYSAGNLSIHPKMSPITVRYVVFRNRDSHAEGQFSVTYFFMVNGEYACNRTDARLLLNKSIFRKQMYLSKVEWKFFSTSSGSPVYPDKQQTIEASEKLLSVLLPVLENDHWPQKVQK
jgi:hypothetical protein